jgi:N-acetyl-anhydromuramyl-L-alanine amidase AmpD
MRRSRRSFLRAAGATAGAGALLGSASTVAAHSKPAMNWVAADDSNYTDGRAGHGIRWFVVHVVEGSYEGCISWFQNPDADASTQYVVENDSAGEITQMVDEADTAWHAGNWDYNRHSLGVEHEGYTDETTFVDGLYRSSAAIARWAGETYGFPLRVRRYEVAPCDADDGAGGIIGHDQIPDPDNCDSGGGGGGHTDPGSTWNWGRYEGFVRQEHVDLGEHVFTTADLSVREGPGTGYSRIDVAPQGAAGEVLDGPVDSDGYRWYEVDYEGSTATGWSAADWLPYCRFMPGVGARTTAALSVRDAPDGAKIDTAPDGTTGTVVDGPVDTGGWRWWKLDYDGVSTGWSAGYWLV